MSLTQKFRSNLQPSIPKLSPSRSFRPSSPAPLPVPLRQQYDLRTAQTETAEQYRPPESAPASRQTPPSSPPPPPPPRTTASASKDKRVQASEQSPTASRPRGMSPSRRPASRASPAVSIETIFTTEGNMQSFLEQEALTQAFESYVNKRSPVEEHKPKKRPSRPSRPQSRASVRASSPTSRPVSPPAAPLLPWNQSGKEVREALGAIARSGGVLKLFPFNGADKITRTALRDVLASIGMRLHCAALANFLAPDGGDIDLTTLTWALKNHHEMRKSAVVQHERVKKALSYQSGLTVERGDGSLAFALSRAKKVLYPNSPRSSRPMGLVVSPMERSLKAEGLTPVRVKAGHGSSFSLRAVDFSVDRREHLQEALAVELEVGLLGLKNVHNLLSEFAVQTDRVNLHCMRIACSRLGLTSREMQKHIFKRAGMHPPEGLIEDLATTASIESLTRIIAPLGSSNRVAKAKALFNLIDDNGTKLLSATEFNTFARIQGKQTETEVPELCCDVLDATPGFSLPITKAICKIFTAIDTSGDGVVDLEEFARACSKDETWSQLSVILQGCRLASVSSSPIPLTSQSPEK